MKRVHFKAFRYVALRLAIGAALLAVGFAIGRGCQ